MARPPPSHAHASRTRSLRRKRTSSLGPKLRTKEWRTCSTTASLTPTSHRRYGAAPRSVDRAGGPSCGWWYRVQHQSAFKLVRTNNKTPLLGRLFSLAGLFSVPTRTKKEPAPNYDPLRMKMGRHVNSSACDLSASHSAVVRSPETPSRPRLWRQRCAERSHPW